MINSYVSEKDIEEYLSKQDINVSNKTYLLALKILDETFTFVGEKSEY